MDVLVAGGGIAGLSLALTCEQIGVPVRVLEEAPELRRLGVGINLQPAAVRELYDLGLEAELAAIAVPTREFVLARRDGEIVVREPRGTDAGSRWPQLSVARGELEMLLHRTVVDRLGPDAVATSRRVSGYEHDLGFVRALVEHGDATESIPADVLVAADGMRSALRAQMFPGEGGPRWGGAVLWRGVAPAPPVRGGSSFVVVGDHRQRFTTFPISPPDSDTGEVLQSWVAQLAFDVNRGWRRRDWNSRVEAGEFVDAFDGWDFEGLDLSDLVVRSPAVLEYPMVDRDPAPRYLHGSVVLIGDAAHAMYPLGSNGASQAIVDARVLGAAFVEHGVGRAALDAYQARRLDEMTTAILRNRRAGPFSVLGTIDESCAAAFDGIGAETSPSALRAAVIRYETSARRAVEALNAAPSTIAAGARVVAA